MKYIIILLIISLVFLSGCVTIKIDDLKIPKKCNELKIEYLNNSNIYTIPEGCLEEFNEMNNLGIEKNGE